MADQPTDDAPKQFASAPALPRFSECAPVRRIRSADAICRPKALKCSAAQHGEATGRDEKVAASHSSGVGGFLALTLGATGVVFGDIGTSPLYTFTGIFIEVLEEEHPTPRDVVDTFSMIFWCLTFVVGFKYVTVVLSVSHHGEGGAFAMLHNIFDKQEAEGREGSTVLKTLVIFSTMLAVSLIAGDGCITPAVSVLGALEGIPVHMSDDARVAMALAIIAFIFLIQRRGSALIGKVAGPITIVWFLAIAAIGVYNLAAHPEEARLVAGGFSPGAIVNFWTKGEYAGVDAWRTLAGVVLSVTGAEALYADMGHFGRAPISVAWVVLVYPCLVLQYMGQATALCVRPHGVVSPFYNAVPDNLKWPMVVLATLAAIIASQAMISGLFSLLTQAYAARFVPKILVLHTNPDHVGQVYIPEVNWALCVACLVICVIFKTSAKLAGAYGIAVTSTFLITTFLLAVVIRTVWRWNWFATIAIILPLTVIDAALWSSVILRIVDSGWVPVLISGVLCFLMHVHLWGHGQERAVMAKEAALEKDEIAARGGIDSPARAVTVTGLQSVLRSGLMVRTDKVVVFLTPYELRVPRTVGALATLLGCLPQTIVLLSVRFESVPFIAEDRRATLIVRSNGVFTVVLHFGYAEPLVAARCPVHKALAGLAREQCEMFPGLAPLVELDRHLEPKSTDTSLALEGGSDGVAVAKAGNLAHRSPTFVVSKVHYARQEGAKHRWWNRVRIAFYAFIQLNARKSIDLLGLQGDDTIEVSIVRYV